jgi:hypothetical protein
MNFCWREAVGASIALSIIGCSGVTQLQDTMSKFDQGAHSISSSEMTFLKSAQTADCNYQFYTSAFEFSNNSSAVPTNSLMVDAPCSPDVLPNQDIVTRQHLMDAITLYADQLQAVASNDADKKLSTNAQSTAASLNSLAKQSKLLTGSATPIVAAVEAAVIGLSDMVLSGVQLSDVRKAASSQSDNLATVVSFLKQENTQLANNMASKSGALENIFDTTISQQKKNGNRDLLLNALAARQFIQNSNPLGTSTMVTGSSGAVADPTSTVQQLNAALDSLVTANDAIATAGTGGIVAAVNDLIARAQAAQAMEVALRK